MEARGQEKDIGMPNLSLSPSFSNKREKSAAPTRPTQTLDPPPLPDPLTSAAESNNHSPPPPPPPPDGGDSIRYKECLKNHAVSMGGHVLDGCGEFMPSGDDGTPRALRCAACDCHRNFHRKEVGGHTPPSHSYRQPHLHQHQQHHHQQQQQHTHAYPTMVSFGANSGGAAAESSSEDLNMFQHGAAAPSYSGSKKRFRTKFSTDQKDRMHEFARKLGWRMQKEDEHQVQDFCRQIGVKREVFKVWMHNNKQAIKKSSSDN